MGTLHLIFTVLPEGQISSPSSKGSNGFILFKSLFFREAKAQFFITQNLFLFPVSQHHPTCFSF
jgi:hypothetical protein